MTLEQTTERILRAAELQDLEALQTASKLREDAMAELHSVPASTNTLHAVTSSIEAGDLAKRAIRAIKQRVRNESRRLANIELAFVRTLRPAAKHQIDFNG